MKRLYKSETNKIGAGVLGGISEYYEVDPILIRLLGLFIAIITGIIPFALMYLLAAIVIPQRPRTRQE
ncbi:PspC domain-containing protein [Candidatus Parcubacteria bacterium]|uniref:PspC domain-containing protein n=1 Tax=Candidatus Kaiserbacteria bacterium CG10_big_fil_rev_8_21_14_0_10_47_16 TaxID=1974608 RepID=A0A2H0UDA2_9BACT|nr:PspC domain-containing protein [Candidatus Parcubacteria bacterium]PIR84389.1 MAG: PspC domain-containing protein [Candidatus Kaiserbacteria bacterium CG10_big_fil_rev_8_21_14_0_10_47_16]